MAVLKLVALVPFWGGLYHSAGQAPDGLTLALIVLAGLVLALSVTLPGRQAARA